MNEVHPVVIAGLEDKDTAANKLCFTEVLHTPSFARQEPSFLPTKKGSYVETGARNFRDSAAVLALLCVTIRLLRMYVDISVDGICDCR